MHTACGIVIDPLRIRPSDIEIEDIAHALARICRYGGHVSGFYSVARHSLLVAEHVETEHALYGLLHDASEAYIGDVITELKHADDMSLYRSLETRVMSKIAERFGLNHPFPASVKEADVWVTANLEPALFAVQGDIATDKRDFLARFYELRSQ